MNALSFLKGFADAQVRLSETTEREVHHDPSGERPEGDGWQKIKTDPSGYSTWERTRLINAAGEWTP